MFHHIRARYPHEELAAALAQHGDWTKIIGDERAMFSIADSVVVGLLHRFDPREAPESIKLTVNADWQCVRQIYVRLIPICAELCTGDVEQICNHLPIGQVGALTQYHLSSS